MSSHGTVRIKIDELLQSYKISKSKLCHRAELQHTQLNNLCKNKTTRLDTDVLARICFAMNCRIEDLLEYVPPTEE